MRRLASNCLSTGFWVAAPAFLIFVSLIVYQPFLRDYFVLDDFIWLHAARTPDAGAFFRDAFGFPARTPFSVPTPFWRPLVDGWFYLTWRLYGENPALYHISNAVIHGANAALLAVLVRQLTHSRRTALVVALLWSVLPAYDYAVLWISEATELLAMFFSLAAIVLFTAALAPGRRRLLLPSLLCAALGLLAKQSAAIMPLVLGMIAVIRLAPQGREGALRVGAFVLPFVLLVLGFGALLYPQDYRTTAEAGIYEAGPHLFANTWDLLLRMAWPFTIPGAHESALSSRIAAGCFLVAGVTVLLRRRGLPSVVFLWTLLALTPYALFPAGTESRYLYLAAAPFTLFVVLLVRDAIALLQRGLPAPVARLGASTAIAAALVPVLVLLGQETRERQAWLHEQAEAYAQMVEEVPALCGRIPSGSRIEIIGSPTIDLFGESTRMALGMRYPGVHVERPATLESAPSAACAVRYEEGRYKRLADGVAGRGR